MSDTTTPKRNEAVAWRLRIGDSDMWAYQETEADVEFHGASSGLPYVTEPLYSQEQIAALQGEVSRLRADAMRYRHLRDHAKPTSGEGFAVLRDQKGSWGEWYTVHVRGDDLDAAIDAATEHISLEPPTDGR